MGISNKVYDLNLASKRLFDGRVEDEYDFVLNWVSKYMSILPWERQSLTYSYEDVMKYFHDKYERLNTDSITDLMKFIKVETRNKILKELISDE